MKSSLLTKRNASFFLLLLLVSLGTPFLQAHAQLAPACGYDLNNDSLYDSRAESCRICHFFVLGNNILNFLFVPPGGLIPIVAVIMFLAGGFMFLVSAGSPGSLDKGKAIIKDTIIALIILYGGWLAIDFFFVVVGVANWTGLQHGWFSIPCP
ncbi:MAG: hypothetical protein Q7S63_03360 [bacterium]|nr:hypothetical protein [bacterium]